MLVVSVGRRYALFVACLLPSSDWMESEKESGAEGEEDIGDSQEPLSQLHTTYGLSNLCTISFLLPRS